MIKQCVLHGIMFLFEKGKFCHAIKLLLKWNGFFKIDIYPVQALVAVLKQDNNSKNSSLSVIIACV